MSATAKDASSHTEGKYWGRAYLGKAVRPSWEQCGAAPAHCSRNEDFVLQTGKED